MRKNRNVMVHFKLTEQTIKWLLCQRLMRTRGHIFTFKTGYICNELFVEEHSQACRTTVRRYLLSTLAEAVIQELTTKNRIVVQVSKARELLGCDNYEN